ncbi:MAG: Sua5/YciO/YrdC/YwlC family protein, partial [Pseudonocardiaceae bacterium]
MIERRRVRVTGTVQGVGFRPFVFRLATGLALAGQVSNDNLGVLIEIEGLETALDQLIASLATEAPPLAQVASLEVELLIPTGQIGFAILDSRSQGAPAVAVSVDAATCEECLAELGDPSDRRFAYPFINCTNCGPRYTIIRSIPYDRAATTMAGFEMCDRCRGEYTNPADRRFHAEPIACADCGPRVTLMDTEGRALANGADAVSQAGLALLDGRILAIKGLGGYHLAADATNPAAVTELRRRKSRDQKPFAVMVGGLAAARHLCVLTNSAEAALTSPRRPIVLAPRRNHHTLAAEVAPGLYELGLMLPYTPLHYLVMAMVGRPLVMTSGNQSDEPIAHDDADAVARLGPMVDAIVGHDRPIHIRCDDSVVRARLGDNPVQMVRRSRGYAPEPINLARPSGGHVLAVGAELKNTVAVAKGMN